METDQDRRTDRRWAIVTLSAWGLISALFFVRALRLWGARNPELSFLAACSVVGGFPLTFIAVSIPYRVLQNLTHPERRRAKLKETAVCIITFLALVNAVYLMVVSYPRDW